MEKTYLKVGGYTPENGSREAVIDREYYGQGWIFKDEEAFLLHLDQVCYVPELLMMAIPGRIFLICVMSRRNLRRSAFTRWTGKARIHGWMSNTGFMNGNTARIVKNL